MHINSITFQNQRRCARCDDHPPPLATVHCQSNVLFLSIPISAAQSSERVLRLRNLHLGEYLASTSCSDDQANELEMAALSELLRDHLGGDIHAINIGVFDVLCRLQRVVSDSATYEVISHYRSPATNAKLNSRSKSVAKRSLLIQGRAIDARLPRTKKRDLKEAAIELRAAGVGYYARSEFVHLDTGPFRTW